MTGPAWLAALQVGDKVIERVSTYGAIAETVREVERLTRTQIVLTGTARRYRRSDGRAAGESGVSLLEATPEALAQVREREERHALIQTLRVRTSYNALEALPLDALRRVVAILGESGGAP